MPAASAPLDDAADASARTPRTPRARMLLIGGASGSGKSRLAEASGLPVLRLDDFYRVGDDPELPLLPSGEVDWDHPGSWHLPDAIAAIEQLATTGRTQVPDYDISRSDRVGWRTLELGDAHAFVAEGIFASEVVAPATERGLLLDAIAVRRPRGATMAFRFLRDLRERRKSPAFLVRRGILLARREPTITRALLDAGCRPLRPRAIRRELTRIAPR
ncbi:MULTISPECIES: ATP-binding protein [unclassified Agrococcus]|uniref:ATP-binding protein n=1 Tax=unclassified Agrococcus TaxID=2615065 RepID=UPI0036120DFF